MSKDMKIDIAALYSSALGVSPDVADAMAFAVENILSARDYKKQWEISLDFATEPSVSKTVLVEALDEIIKNVSDSPTNLA